MTAAVLRKAGVVQGQARREPALWRPEDVLATAVPSAVGVVLWMVGWYQVSGSDAYAKQIGWADLAIGGFILATTSQLIWLLRGRRAVGELRRQLLRVRVPDAGSWAASPAPVVQPQIERAEIVVAGPNKSLFHRPDCPMVAGRGWTARPRRDIADPGLRPCGVCQP